MLARSSSFSADNLGYHQGFVVDFHKVFKWYLPSKEMCLTID